VQPDPLIVLPVLDVERAEGALDSMALWLRLRTLVIDNSCSSFDPPGVFRTVHPQENLGVAASWNVGVAAVAVERYRSHLVTLSTSVRFDDGGAGLIQALADHPLGFVSHVWWHVAAIGAQVVSDVGLFDTGFRPAYFEDSDYERRMLCAGHHIPNGLHVAGVRSLGTAHSLRAGLVEIDFGRLARRYERKWGGPPGQERYRFAWDRRGS
jgi:hypothetical protein